MAKGYFKGNDYIIEDDVAKIIINSPKHGYFEALIDSKNVNICTFK